MDNKRLVIVMLLSLAVVLAWSYVNTLLKEKHPEWFQQPQQATTQPAPQPSAQSTASAQAPEPATRVAAATAPATGKPYLVEVEQRQAIASELGHGKFDPKAQQAFPLGLSIDPRGAALRFVTLNRFRQEVEKDEPYVFQHPYDDGTPAMGAASITVDGSVLDLSKVNWRRTGEPTQSSAAYAVDIAIPGWEKPLTVGKSFELRPRQSQGAGYEVLVRYTLDNQTGADVRVKLFFHGPNVPSLENSRDVPEVVVGHNTDQRVVLAHTPGTSFTPEKGPVGLLDGKKGPILWAGITSAYFNAIVAPEVKDGKPVAIADVSVHAPAPPDAKGQQRILLTFETTELTLSPGKTLAVPLEVYFGPRQRAVLNSDYYEAFPRSYEKTLVLTGGMCGFCTFQWLIDILVWMLTVFHVALRDWGLAIIALVLIVRLLLHPITKKSQVSMSKMTKMGPEMERLKKKYADNKEELNKAMMAFYKEQGVTPILGCLPMLLQMPIWIALWSCLQSTFELRHASFLWGLTWIRDLAQPDRLVHFPNHPLSFFFIYVDAINILPLLLAVVFYLQQKMTPQPAAATPEQEQQQKMMRWMSLLFPVLLYTGPSGLNLYILTSTAIGIWESKRVRDHIKEQEERQNAGRVVVDAKPTQASRRLPRGEHPQAAGKGCLGGWLSNIKAKMSSIQDETEKRYGKDRK
jgi:YidC/Oxa1 family membrane protein insertase